MLLLFFKDSRLLGVAWVPFIAKFAPNITSCLTLRRNPARQLRVNLVGQEAVEIAIIRVVCPICRMQFVASTLMDCVNKSSEYIPGVISPLFRVLTSTREWPHAILDGTQGTS